MLRCHGRIRRRRRNEPFNVQEEDPKDHREQDDEAVTEKCDLELKGNRPSADHLHQAEGHLTPVENGKGKQVKEANGYA